MAQLWWVSPAGCVLLWGVWLCLVSVFVAAAPCVQWHFKKNKLHRVQQVCYINRQCHLKSSLGANDGSSECREEGWVLQWLFPVVLAVVACYTTWGLWPQRFRDGQRLGENCLFVGVLLLQCKVSLCHCLVLSVLSTLVSCSCSPLHIVASLFFLGLAIPLSSKLFFFSFIRDRTRDKYHT